MFHWAGPFLGPGKWACEPYFLSHIKRYLSWFDLEFAFQ